MGEKKINIYQDNIILFLVFIITIINTNYINISDTYILGGSDGVSYYQIAKSSPYIAENLPQHKSWRFFFPYIFGIIAKTLNIEIFLIFKIMCLFISLHSIIILKKLFDKENKNLTLIFISSIICNPYFVKYYYALPLLINDLIFIYSTILICFIYKDKKKFYLGLIIACLCRQESILILLAIIILNLFFLRKKIFSYREFNLILLIYLFIYSINFYYSSSATNPSELITNYNHKIRFGLFFQSVNTFELIEFLLLPFIPFAFIVFFIFLEFKNVKNNIIKINSNQKLFFFLIVSLFLIAVPVLAGVKISGRNLIRLSNFSIIFISYFIFLIHNQAIIKKKTFYLYVIFLILFSLHPTYSNFSIFIFK